VFRIDFVFPFKLGGAVYENGDSDMVRKDLSGFG